MPVRIRAGGRVQLNLLAHGAERGTRNDRLRCTSDGRIVAVTCQVRDVTCVVDILLVVLKDVGCHVNPVGTLQVDAPAIVAQCVLIDDPVESTPLAAFRLHVANQGDAGPVVARRTYCRGQSCGWKDQT